MKKTEMQVSFQLDESEVKRLEAIEAACKNAGCDQNKEEIFETLIVDSCHIDSILGAAEYTLGIVRYEEAEAFISNETGVIA